MEEGFHVLLTTFTHLHVFTNANTKVLPVYFPFFYTTIRRFRAIDVVETGVILTATGDPNCHR